MKKQDIRNIYTQKVTELLNQGYTIYPDTMSGSQGEIAHIDLAKGSEILRVLLERGLAWHHLDDGYHGDVITLTVGRAEEDPRLGMDWHGTIWNNRLEPVFQIEWAEINSRHEGWYTDLEEAKRIGRLQRKRYKAAQSEKPEQLSDAYKSIALRWLKKQPRMKTCRLEDIESIERVRTGNGTRHFEITAKGKIYILR